MKNKQQSNSITLNLIRQFVPLWKIHLCRGHCNPKPDQSLTISNQSQAFSSLFLRLFLWPKPQTFCSLSPFSHSYRSLSLSLHSSRWLSFHTTRKLGIENLDVHSQIPSVSIQCEDKAFMPFSSYQVTVLPAPPGFVSSVPRPVLSAADCPTLPSCRSAYRPLSTHLAEMQKCRSIWMGNATMFTELYAGKKFSASFHRSLGRTWNFNPWGKHLIVLNIGAKNWFPGSSSISDKLDGTLAWWKSS